MNQAKDRKDPTFVAWRSVLHEHLRYPEPKKTPNASQPPSSDSSGFLEQGEDIDVEVSNPPVEDVHHQGTASPEKSTTTSQEVPARMDDVNVTNSPTHENSAPMEGVTASILLSVQIKPQATALRLHEQTSAAMDVDKPAASSSMSVLGPGARQVNPIPDDVRAGVRDRIFRKFKARNEFHRNSRIAAEFLMNQCREAECDW
ncbi:hypothetical protein CC78DRAFT_310095 [Lojkania enalia]|uniref:Uncharacterized protein n=1 Tax=Lojkania enalia TaxID=147567 RepID=A0A9P4N1T3_9PLEO|nr:hypothetical protein CC78DRAFT_310095 [Didymosphaeria enalia]